MSGRPVREQDVRDRSVEWPTVGLAVLIYAGWGLATAFHRILPGWMLPPIGAWLIAWHNSLQHETIHGHPTRSRRVNALIGGAPLSLWLPYACYRRNHIAHHRSDITHPVEDPESRYLARSRGAAAALRRAAAVAQSTLLGWMLLGPITGVALFLAGEARRLATRPAHVARDWWPHMIGLALIFGWLAYWRMPVGIYLATFVYPGAALSLLRSYAEHRAADRPGHRVAVVERAGPFGLLFLHNNLHAAHHLSPGLAWYRLPDYFRRNRGVILDRNGGLLYRGYSEILRRFAFRPHDSIVNPLFE